jgi:hypothetical protein
MDAAVEETRIAADKVAVLHAEARQRNHVAMQPRNRAEMPPCNRAAMRLHNRGLTQILGAALQSHAAMQVPSHV